MNAAFLLLQEEEQAQRGFPFFCGDWDTKLMRGSRTGCSASLQLIPFVSLELVFKIKDKSKKPVTPNRKINKPTPSRRKLASRKTFQHFQNGTETGCAALREPLTVDIGASDNRFADDNRRRRPIRSPPFGSFRKKTLKETQVGPHLRQPLTVDVAQR